MENKEGSPGKVKIDVEKMYEGNARLLSLPEYERRALEQAGEGRDIVLTGKGPVWLYLALAHTLHGKARKLYYSSPVTGDILIFDHSTE